MTDHFSLTVASLQQKIQEHEQSILKIKKTINQLAEVEGHAPVYADADLQVSSSAPSQFRPDQFFGKPLAGSVKAVLEQRQKMNLGAASPDDLYTALVAGGYDFGTPSETNAKRILAISLGKNMLFQRTPNGHWGMRKWYNKSAKRKGDTETESGGEAEQENDQDTESEGKED